MVRLAEGDRGAFDAVFAGLWPELLAFVRGAMAGHPDAEDLAQRTLLKIFFRISEFDTSRDGVAWAFGIAIYEVRTLRRTRQRRREVSADAAIAGVDGRPSPEAMLLESDLRRALAESLGELADGELYEQRLLEQALARIREWVRYADERLGPSGMKIYFAPGNDDPPAVDEAFVGSSVFVNCEQQVVDLGGIQMASTGWSNPTPWKTPRECTEDQLEERLRSAVAGLSDPAASIFNFHVPPHGTSLDICPELDDDFKVVTVMGAPVQMHAGSTAVRAVVEEFQPLVSLHGHIHESRNAVQLGRTWAVNPGSEYGEGVLCGAIITIKKQKVKYTFTAG